jgi:hypothetical protein
MRISFGKPAVLGLAAVGLTLGLAPSASANPFLPVQNLTFSSYTGAAPKNNFSTVNPTGGWQRGAPAGSGDLVFIDAPGTATSPVGGYAVYGPFANPPPGGNFVQADGNPDFESTFFQQISGLTIGQQYDLSFWQAAGQQQGFTGATTEQWRVFLGNDPVTLTCVPGSCSVDPNTNQEQDSTLMNTPSQGVSPWQQVTMTFTATAASEALTFLAWGNGGSTVNLPPTVFLAGVNSPAVPEPATLSLLGVGLIGLGGTVLRQRSKRKAAR